MIERAYTETTLEAEKIAFLNSEKRADVLAWLTAPNYGREEKEWDDD